MSKADSISRRDFLKQGTIATGLLLSGGWLRSALAQDEEQAPLERRNEQEGMSYRRFGKTNLAFSVMGIGGMEAPKEVFVAAIEAGMNYVQSYRVPPLIEVLRSKELRERIFLIGQAHADWGVPETVRYATRKATVELVDSILQRHDVEQIDILNCHISGYEYFPEHMHETKQMLIEQGKIRFLTSSHHNAIPPGDDPGQTLAKFAELYDGFFGGLSFTHLESLPAADFTEHDIGLVAFKPLRGVNWTEELDQRAHQEGINKQEAAMRWLLAQPDVIVEP